MPPSGFSCHIFKAARAATIGLFHLSGVGVPRYPQPAHFGLLDRRGLEVERLLRQSSAVAAAGEILLAHVKTPPVWIV